jgi:two-component system sensor histidine kinase KdpD
LERVFEPFYRAGTHSGGHRGSGLGLAIARGFTEANSGSLHVESLPGQGAAFVFELPLEERAAGVEGEQPEAQSGQPERERAADAPLLAASAARAGASARARDSGG